MMVEEYFGFSAAPFKLSPDARFFFGSKSHTKAMAYLHYGLQQAEGFIVITGEIGAGKSMLIGHMLEQLNDNNVSAAHLLTSNLAAEDLLPHILSSFQIEPQGSGRPSELEAFEDFLYDNVNRGRRVLLVVDEAQNLPVETIEELRMLTNINYQGTPLFQVFLVGQPEFRGVIAGKDMEQLRQRIIATYHLEALDQTETREYIEHRLAIVGRVDKPAFTEEAFEAIYKFTQGVPRRINTLCTRTLLFCALEKRNLINSVIVSSVANELQQEVFTPAINDTLEQNDEEPLVKTTHEEAPDLQPLAPSSSIVNNDVIVPFESPTLEGDDEVGVQSDDNSLRDVFGLDDKEDVPTQNIAANHDDLGAEIKNSATLKDVATAIAELSKKEQSAEGQQTNDIQGDVSEVIYTAHEQSTTSLEENSEMCGEDSAITSPTKPAAGVEASVMDRILSLRTDLHEAHVGNRKIYNTIADMEEKSVDNIIQIERHIQKANTIINDLQSEL